MKHNLPSAFIFLVLGTYVYALAPHSLNDSPSTLNKNYGNYLHETALKRRDSTYLQLPIFQHSRTPLLDKQQFSPARGVGREQLSEDTRKVLIPGDAPRATSRRNGRSYGINVACYLKKMIVKVNKQILGPSGFQAKLKLGTCDISKSTKNHYLFIYDMDQCGSRRKMINNRVAYSNILHYSPVTAQGSIRRAMPFSIKIECHFNRYHYSYKIGFTPQVNFQNYFRPLKTVDSFVLTPRDAQWRRLSPTEAYTIGHPMYFQADGPSLAEDERLFVDSCYATVNSSHLSKPRFTVIENHGCMTDSKSSRWSGFIQSKERNVVQFSLDAFLFYGMSGKHLYMHCKISVGGVTPTPSSKSCTYNQAKKRWEELYGFNTVCSCCDSKCTAFERPATSKVITSDVWTMESDWKIIEEEPTTALLSRVESARMVQIMATLAPDIGPHHYVPGLALVEKAEEYVEPYRRFEEVFGLD